MIVRYSGLALVVICLILQVRNYNRYLVDHRRKNDEAMVYLNSDVCSDPITKAQLGTFNLCKKASHIVSENPRTTALYDILNDWYPCGHGRCEGVADWTLANLHWFVMAVVVIVMMFYFKWVEHQRDILYTKMRLPSAIVTRPVEHVD